ncbi:hypothetical protein HY490_01565 [Candidatus Woesearchaeota archaeon]|nr:hypothetical protein [Candidatus Woesearchaeota archaeon]
MGALRNAWKNPRMLILIIALVMALVAIRPNPWADGVVIKSVLRNSSAELGGIESPKPNLAPMSKEVITSMNNVPIKTLSDYYAFVDQLQPNRTVQVATTKGVYRISTKEKLKELATNETVLQTVEEVVPVNVSVNGTVRVVNETRNVTRRIQKTITVSEGLEDIGLRVDHAPTSNLKKGLDLQGGTRVLLTPADDVSDDVMEVTVENLKQRLNVYGLSDLTITTVHDKPGILGKGNKYILVEIAGATEEEVKELLARQGKFEAKVGNATVFSGGNDVTFVCRTADCSGLDPHRGCGKSGNEWACSFSFSISLSPEAAQRQAEATKNLDVVPRSTGEGYLSEQLRLFLDDVEVDALNIAEDLKGRAVTEIQISGSGIGISEDAAAQDTLENMKKLQTVLITGSLPVRLDVVKVDNISPALGEQFMNNAWRVGLLALVGVTVLLGVVYRRIKITVSIMITSFSEILMVLGMAALIGWNIDLAAVAGIIIAVGTGVNDQIVITDEAMRKRKNENAYLWKDRLKQAFFVIFSAYFTTVAAMVPLLFAGAGLLKGFALTTIIGITVGVFITRPAYAAAIGMLVEAE